MKKQRVLFSALIVLLGTTIFNSCKKEENPDLDNPEELITTLMLEFEHEGSGDISTFIFRDTDGPGGAAPSTFDTIRLEPLSEYHVSVTLLNESVTPADDITNEVEEEGTSHQMFYTISAGLELTVSYEDMDADGEPIGLHVLVTTGDTGSGTTTVTLKHQPGVKNGNIATGDTDVEVTFETRIQ